MPVAALRSSSINWYSPAPGQENRDIAAEAYHNAVALLKAEVGIAINVPVPIENQASIDDVYMLVENARKDYVDGSRNHASARKWLEDLAGRILHYKPVLDTLAQVNSEYGCLAWGALKFVLMGIINRATLVEEFSKAIVAIGDVLPRAHLSVELYRTADMEAALSRLYTCLLLFFRLCVRWYKKSSWGRLWSSLKDPFELKYKDLIGDIKLCSTLIEGLASAGARVEIRNIHALSESEHSKLLKIDANVDKIFDVQMIKLSEMNGNIMRIADRQVDLEAQMVQMMQMATINKSMTEQMSGDVSCMGKRLYRLEFHQVVQFLMPKESPEAVLLKAQSLARRNPTLSLPTRDHLRLQTILRDWASNECSSILALRAGLRAQKQATELAANVVEHLRGRSQCVFWNISAGLRSKRKVTMTDVLKTIISQTLLHSGELFTEFAEQLNLSKIQSPHTEREWVELACLVLAKIPRPFLVIDTGDVYRMYRDDQDWVERFVELFNTIVDGTTAAGCQVKVLLLLYDQAAKARWEPSKNKNLTVASLQPPTPVPPRFRRLAGHSGIGIKGWKLQKPN